MWLFKACRSTTPGASSLSAVFHIQFHLLMAGFCEWRKSLTIIKRYYWRKGWMPMATISPSIFSCVLFLVAQSSPMLCNPMDCSLPGLSVHGDSPGKDTGVGCHALLQGIFPTKGLNPGLLHCRQILYCLSHKRSPRILEWAAYPFSRGSSRNWTGVSCTAGGFFTSWATREGPEIDTGWQVTFHGPIQI